jgi:hypothetical protein
MFSKVVLFIADAAAEKIKDSSGILEGKTFEGQTL